MHQFSYMNAVIGVTLIARLAKVVPVRIYSAEQPSRGSC